jgi:hypothetical protein
MLGNSPALSKQDSEMSSPATLRIYQHRSVICRIEARAQMAMEFQSLLLRGNRLSTEPWYGQR